MPLDPETFALLFRSDMDSATVLSVRSRHSDEGGIGASSFGCREEMRRILAKEPASDAPDMMRAIIGSYVDEGLKRDRKAANPRLIVDAELTVTLPNGFSFPVHPDEIDPDEPSVTDYKTKDGLEAIRRGLTDDQYRFQRHIQTLAAIQAGIVGENAVARNVFIDRSGRDGAPHVEQEPFSQQIIEQATEWLDDVLYAREHDEEAWKDRPRVFCEQFCRFYTACREPEIDVEEITDPKLAALVDALGEADQRAKAEKSLIDELKKGDVPLAGLTGRTENFRIVSKWVNSAKQTPHWRVEVKPVNA